MPNPFATGKLKKMTRHEPITVQHAQLQNTKKLSNA